MVGTIHALILLSFAALAIGSILILKKRWPPVKSLILAPVLSALGMLAAYGANTHLCYSGEPRTQWLILGPCLMLVLLVVREQRARRVLASGIFIAMIGLSCHFTNMVHQPGWTGNPDYDHSSLFFRSRKATINTIVEEHPDPDAVLPEGWLRDTALWNTLEEQTGPLRFERTVLHPAWHTPFTGLYPCDGIPQDIWYPGGPIRQVPERMELRDRESP